jgi:hypothetical protein
MSYRVVEPDGTDGGIIRKLSSCFNHAQSVPA